METIQIEEKINEQLDNLVEKVIKFFDDKEGIDYITGCAQSQRKQEVEKCHAKNSRHNIYGYYIKDESGNWMLVYIGQTDKKYSLQRMTQHLVKKSESVNSKYQKLKDIEELGFKSMVINPEALRHFFEVRLIERLKPPLNQHSKKETK